MKYIRTSDGAIYEMINDNTITFCGKEIKVTLKDSNHRIADSIEELCDEIVYNHQILSKEDRYNKEYLSQLLFFNDVYGAVWTQLGLSYQAKMNEKGEWELL